MKYMPAVAIALVVGAAVSLSIYVTKEPVFLVGLIALVLAYWAIPGK